MKINFSDGWCVKTFDSGNIVTEKEDGVIDGYFPDLSSALCDLLDMKILKSDKESVQEIITLIRETKKEILLALEEKTNG